MRLREATQNDVWDMGIIQADCNLTDTIGRYFIHRQEEYPTSYRRSSVRFCKGRANAPGNISFVIETEPSDHAPEDRHKAPEVAAFAVWTRYGKSEAAQKWTRRNTDIWSKFERFCRAAEDRYLRFFPTVHPTDRQDKLRKIMPLLGIGFDKEVFAEAWELYLLFVNPKWQGRGMGKMLVQWGFDRAREEKVPVVLKSSPKGGPVYRRMGFRSLGDVGLRKLFDTTEFGGEEPQMWCWEPEECRDMWYDRGKAAFEKLMAEGRGSAAAAVEEKIS